MKKAGYIETPIDYDSAERSDAVLGEGDETVFGSGMVSEGVLQANIEDNKESAKKQADEYQAKKIGASVIGMIFRGKTEAQKQEEALADERIADFREKAGRRLAYLNRNLKEAA